MTMSLKHLVVLNDVRMPSASGKNDSPSHLCPDAVYGHEYVNTEDRNSQNIFGLFDFYQDTDMRVRILIRRRGIAVFRLLFAFAYYLRYKSHIAD